MLHHPYERGHVNGIAQILCQCGAFAELWADKRTPETAKILVGSACIEALWRI